MPLTVTDLINKLLRGGAWEGPQPVTLMDTSGNAYNASGGSTIPAGSNNIGGVEVIDSGGTNKLAVDSGGKIGVNTLPALPAGTNVIGHVIIDSAGSVTITTLPALPTGTNVIGHVIVDSAGSVTITSLPSLPAGSNNIGGVEIIDSAGTNKLVIDSSGRLTLIPNSSVNAAQIGGQTPTLDNTTVLAISMRGKGAGTAGDTALLLNSDGSVQNDLRKVAGNAIAPGNNAVPILNSAATGYVAAYGSNAAALTSNVDYTFKWGAGGTTQVNHIALQNNSGATLNYALDVAATSGSFTLANGSTIFLDVQTSVLHLLQTGTPAVNGSSASNIVVQGWL